MTWITLYMIGIKLISFIFALFLPFVALAYILDMVWDKLTNKEDI